ncbi:MAG: hypothetical protein WC670_19460 [Pseudolabrys sp.]|jgi:hypothetical protein
MRRTVALAAALIAAVTFTLQTAEAGGRHHIDKRLKVVALGAGAASTAGYFWINDWHWKWQNGRALTSLGAIAATTMGCAAISPMVGTVVLNRPLTQREGHVLIGSCIVPIIGGYLVNAAYDAHPDWDPQPVVAKKHWKKKK